MSDDPVRDVTILMMVRHMPDDDFMCLCERVLDAQGFTLGSNEDMQQQRTSANVGDQSRTMCMVCGEAAPDVALTAKVEALAGLTACKRCIDAALVALFTDRQKQNRLASQLSVIFRNRRRSERARRAAA